MRALAYVAPKRVDREPILTPAQSAMAAKLGARLRELREGKGLTQATVSRRSGINRPNVARIEAGRWHVPQIETVVRFARAIGVQPSEVFAVLDEVAE